MKQSTQREHGYLHLKASRKRKGEIKLINEFSEAARHKDILKSYL